MTERLTATTPEEEKRIAAEAEALINNELLKAALAAILERCRRDIEYSDPGHAELRERSYFVMRGMHEFVGLLTEFVESGSLAKSSAEDIKPPA